MANIKIEDALNFLRDGMYSGKDVIEFDYGTVLEVYNCFKELAWLHKRMEAELSMCRNDRIRDYEDRLHRFTEYQTALKQYACECDNACGEELGNADYCGWKAKQLIT